MCTYPVYMSCIELYTIPIKFALFDDEKKKNKNIDDISLACV